MVTDLQMALPADPVSVRRARDFVDRMLHRIGEHVHAELAQLLVSELATNAVLHARSEFVVAVLPTRPGVRVEVRDVSRAVAARRSFQPDASTGRGMVLVSELADAWGCDVGRSGKTVWFTLDGTAGAGV